MYELRIKLTARTTAATPNSAAVSAVKSRFVVVVVVAWHARDRESYAPLDSELGWLSQLTKQR